jgi:hypothetical protein
MAGRDDLEFTYSLIDRIFRLSLGELADFSGAKYDGDFSLTLEEAQRRKHDYVAEQIGIGPKRSRAAPYGRDCARCAGNAASREAARARELRWPWVQLQMLVPVIAGGVKRIVDALPRGALGFFKQNAHAPLVGALHSSAEMLGDGRKELVGTPSGALHVDDDRGQRHQSRS